jgi:serine/threonine protein kinase
VINFCDQYRGNLLTRDDPSAFAAPAQFGPFRVLHQIGVGALGPVFRTYEPERDRLVAVKAFRLDITPEQAQALADELTRSAEAGLFHPSIVEPIAAGVEGTVAYCAEEYVAAESLDVAMRHYAPAPIATVLPFITQLAGAIDFARAAGVGHGALHPRDIFVTPEEARATGFGVVEALERVGLRAPVRRPYSPPERIAGTPWNATADVFSLAAITFELLTGRRPAGLGTRDRHAHGGHAQHLDGRAARGADARDGRRTRDALSNRPRLRRRARSARTGRDCPLRLGCASLRTAAHHRSCRRSVVVPPSVPPTRGLADQPTSRPADQPFDSATPRSRQADRCHERAGKSRESNGRPADEPTRRHHRGTGRRRGRGAAEDRGSGGAVVCRDVHGLDGDIAAEAEADRFVADDFLLDAAGAASAVPEPPLLNTRRVATSTSTRPSPLGRSKTTR